MKKFLLFKNVYRNKYYFDGHFEQYSLQFSKVQLQLQNSIYIVKVIPNHIKTNKNM